MASTIKYNSRCASRLPGRLNHLRKICVSGRPARWVYIIRSGDFVKIGITDDVERRLCSLQIGNPVKLVLMAKFKTWDASRIESELHDRLGGHRERGEWFRLEASVLDWIDSFA